MPASGLDWLLVASGKVVWTPESVPGMLVPRSKLVRGASPGELAVASRFVYDRPRERLRVGVGSQAVTRSTLKTSRVAIPDFKLSIGAGHSTAKPGLGTKLRSSDLTGEAVERYRWSSES